VRDNWTLLSSLYTIRESYFIFIYAAKGIALGPFLGHGMGRSRWRCLNMSRRILSTAGARSCIDIFPNGNLFTMRQCGSSGKFLMQGWIHLLLLPIRVFDLVQIKVYSCPPIVSQLQILWLCNYNFLITQSKHVCRSFHNVSKLKKV